MISASFRLENRFDAPIMPHLQAEIPPLNFVRAVSTLRCIKFRTGSLDFKMHSMFSHDMYGSF